MRGMQRSRGHGAVVDVAECEGEGMLDINARARALVVDDNVAALFAVSAMCQSMGFDVDEADGADAALALYEAKTYDLVVSDINMPGEIDGIQLARRIRRKNANQSIILMTGCGERFGSGAAEFVILAKPFGVEDLRKILA
jgi:CheY-like chemotaxis protein